MTDSRDAKTDEATAAEPRSGVREASEPVGNSQPPFAVDIPTRSAVLPGRTDLSDNGRVPRAGHPVDSEGGTGTIRALVILEAAVCLALILWIQVVGVVTERIATHVVHALPFVPLLILRKRSWVRATSVSVCLIWIFAMSLMSPMVRQAIVEGGLWRDGSLSTWLAPGVVLLCGLYAALNLTILAGSARRLPLFLSCVLLLIPSLALIRPAIHGLFTVPVSGVLTGHRQWVIVLVVEFAAALALFRYLTVRLARRTDLPLSGSVLVWQVIFWAFFVACTAVGVPYAAFPNL